MFVKTVKVKKPGAALAGAAAILLCIIVVIAMIIGKAGKPTVYTLKTEAQRQDFMKSMGWKVSEEYTECKVITIPEEFNDVYKSITNCRKSRASILKSTRERPLKFTPIRS